MKTTIDISDELLLAAKQEALNRGTSLKQVLELALTQLLKPKQVKYIPIKTIVFPALGTKKQPFPSNEELWAGVYPLPSAFPANAGLPSASKAANKPSVKAAKSSTRNKSPARRVKS